jgi:CheY-like chemotaxis protein
MLRILVVEDDETARDQLTSNIREEFPEAEIHVASTVEDAHRLIDHLISAGDGNYDITIDDFRVPGSKGDNPEGTTELCQRMPPEVLVIHITAYPNDAAIQDHMRQERSHRSGSSAGLIPKDPGWTDQVVNAIRSKLISDEMVNLFGPQGSHATPARHRQQSPGAIRTRCSLTHPLARLKGDIAQYWEGLDRDLQKRVRDTFGDPEEKA